NHQLLGATLLRLSRFAEAKEVYEQAFARNLEPSGGARYYFYRAALALGDTATMQRQIDWLRQKGMEPQTLVWEAQRAISAGRLQQAQELYTRAAGGSVARPNLETALWESVAGNCQQSAAHTKPVNKPTFGTPIAAGRFLMRKVELLFRCGAL